MRHLATFLVLTSCLGTAIVGCSKSGDAPSAGGSPPSATDPALADAPDAPTGASEETSGDSGTDQLALTPDNTRIQFVGNHVGDDPNPRTGHFQEFAGELGWDSDSGALRSIRVTIQTSSLTTEITKLTNHLHSSDFFDVNEHPEASFVSTSIESADGGTFQVSGDLTLLGNTHPIQFPARIDARSEELRLTSEFAISRSQFGMTYGADSVEDEVFLTVTVNGGVE